jgi:four helix bundle protein
MKSARRFEELEIWRDARRTTKFIYEVTRNSAFRQDPGLTRQMRNAGVSIMSNIAEGFSRKSDKEFRRFLLISKGSASELQSHSYVALYQSYISQTAFQNIYAQLNQILCRLSVLIGYLSKNIPTKKTLDTGPRTQ